MVLLDNNLFYIPVLLVYMAGIFALAGGSRTADLVNQRVFVGSVALGWLAVIAVANIRGMAVGKWVQNLGGISTGLSIGLVLAAAAAASFRGVAEHPPAVARFGWEMAASFAVMCNAYVGVELASTMGDEIHDASRNLPTAIYIAGATWMVAPLAVAMGLAIGGTASAWFAGSSRIPFVAGLTSALPAALGRVHSRWHSPHVALATCAVLAALFTCWSLVGSGVAKAYQLLLKSAVIIQLIPFSYLFVGLIKLDDAGASSRVAGLVGALATLGSIVAAFIPTADVTSVPWFEAKLVFGVAGPVAVGWILFRRTQQSRPPLTV
jgi:amino acid transporter